MQQAHFFEKVAERVAQRVINENAGADPHLGDAIIEAECDKACISNVETRRHISALASQFLGCINLPARR